MPMRTLLTVTAAAAIALSSASASAQNDDVVLYDYVVKKGDTCIRIAIRELGDRKAYKIIHQYNKLGKLPHRLKPGSILRLPKRDQPVRPDANLTGKRGDVQVRKPANELWASAKRGMDLFRAWRVNSKDRSTAEITFRDSSRIAMRENTIVIIYGPTVSRARQRTTVATLEKGALRTRLAELDGKPSKLVVEMPSSQAELSNGSALVTVDDKATTRVSNHDGRAAKLRGRRGRAIAVRAGMGSKAERGKRPTKPKPLPPTPAWEQSPTLFAGWASAGATIRGRWKPVAEAVEYRVELSRDSAGTDVIARVVVPANVNAFEAHNMPGGDFYARVASIDADKFESKPSTASAAKVVLLEAVPPGGAAKGATAPTDANTIDTSKPTPAPRALVGSRVVAPAGFTCTVAGASQAGVVSQPGPQKVACTDKSGTVLEPTTVEGVAIGASLGSTSASANSGPLPRGQVTKVAVEVDSDVPVELSNLEFTVGAGATIGEPTIEGSTIYLPVTPAADAPKSVELVVSATGAPDVRVAALALKVAAIEVKKPADPPPQPEPAEKKIAAGFFVGASVVDSEFQLGNAFQDSGVVDGGFVFGIRGSYALLSHLRLEAEFDYSKPGFTGTEDSTDIFGLRLHALVPLTRGELQPFAVAGFGAHILRTDATMLSENDADGEVFWGLGAAYHIEDRFALRVDLRHILGPGRFRDFGSMFAAFVGIGFPL